MQILVGSSSLFFEGQSWKYLHKIDTLNTDSEKLKNIENCEQKIGNDMKVNVD